MIPSLSDNQDKPKQKVRFDNDVKVVLIPTREEYEEAQLTNLLWWSEDQYKQFKKSALAELKLFLLAYPSLDTKSALKIIYQPIENSEAENVIHNAGLQTSINSRILKSFSACSFNNKINKSTEHLKFYNDNSNYGNSYDKKQ